MDEYTSTRRALHGVAELLLAGPQYRRSGTIRLTPAAGGFATIADPVVAVREDLLVVAGAEVAVLRDLDFAALGQQAGLEAGPPEGLYHDGSGITPSDLVRVDPGHAATVAAAFDLGHRALLRLAPDERPVLWPEHFDLGITLTRVNFGISPGDDLLPEPYAYIGPWDKREGPFWNQPFGAARTLADLGDVDAVVGFFQEGARLASE